MGNDAVLRKGRSKLKGIGSAGYLQRWIDFTLQRYHKF